MLNVEMKKTCFFLHLFVAIGLVSAILPNGDVVLRELGEKEYRTIKEKATHESNFLVHGACWHNALKVLESSCDRLNDHEHSLLALRLANCFLEDSGHVVYNCHLSESANSRRECINSMSDRAFGVYNEFYTHSAHICFFLNHEMWQAETENNIERLYKASMVMREQLLEATEMQSIVLESQREGLRIQNELLDHGKELGNVIRTSAETVSGMVVDFKESAKDQRELLYEIFSYMRTFQNWILSEVSWFQSIAYYTVACIICALLSSSKRTAEARISLFTILSLNVTAERMLVCYIVNHSPDDKIELVNMSWYFRKIGLVLCIFTLVYTYYSYNDNNFENYKILRRIDDRLNHIQTETTQPLRFSKRLALKRSKDNNPEH
ncbi:uncharacterized protein [Venturia canescens]|uniref:uncharacterized protein n=1 Tax=Venturia canescens TaxID=32260 RepID=UPI001C9CD9F2|nr:uncharacterized protein LOC122413960 [Venturia canescens]